MTITDLDPIGQLWITGFALLTAFCTGLLLGRHWRIK